ncbi:hypothetical protein, partial [Candidatus Avelusimicrobium caledoniensis]|uniref:hypothetical protein n=1 Tax=Candidatus Avelusimicrobium caledoniensis TaxID=3416220 RepID=UPI003D123595
LFAFLAPEKLAKECRPMCYKKQTKWEIFQTRYCSNMKNFLSISALFINSTQGAEKRNGYFSFLLQ